MNFQTGLKSVIALCGSYITYLLGGWDLALQTLYIMVGLDMFTGLLKAIYQGELSSRIGYKGLIRKIMIFVTVVVAYRVDLTLGIDALLTRNGAIIFWIVNEGISILENAKMMDLPVPKIITDKLLQIKKEGEE